MALIGSNNAEKIWNYFKSKGLTEYGIAGLMGNLKAESVQVARAKYGQENIITYIIKIQKRRVLL